MSEQIVLEGITWNHTRGVMPLLATAQRFADMRPGVEIRWARRTLQEFADFPIQKLAERYDLIIIDHPFVGYAAKHPTLLPLDTLLPAEYLADQMANSVGASYPSYEFGGHLWALPTDAATPVASWRPDVLARHDAEVPRTWEELLALAGRGLVALPAIPVDALMATYMLCLALGETPCATTERMVSEETGVAALELLRELASRCEPACLERNPIRTAEAMLARDDLGYCPFAYGYSNYCREDYAWPRPTLRYGNLVEFGGKRLRSTLGGTGLAITTRCTGERLALALEYAAYVNAPETQRGLYTVTGGQPGHRSAWLDDGCNRLTNGFFRDTLTTLDEAWLRPRYAGYIHFQDEGGAHVTQYLRDGGDPRPYLAKMDAIYRESLTHA